MSGTATPRGPQVQCPHCGKPVHYDALSPYRPFCSERCRLIDLGAWAEERYRVPADTPPDGQLPPGNDD